MCKPRLEPVVRGAAGRLVPAIVEKSRDLAWPCCALAALFEKVRFIVHRNACFGFRPWPSLVWWPLGCPAPFSRGTGPGLYFSCLTAFLTCRAHGRGWRYWEELDHGYVCNILDRVSGVALSPNNLITRPGGAPPRAPSLAYCGPGPDQRRLRC